MTASKFLSHEMLHLQTFFSHFKWTLDFGSFYLAFSFFSLILFIQLQFWQVWNRPVRTKICQPWKIRIFCLQLASLAAKRWLHLCTRFPKHDHILKTQQWILEQTENVTHLLSHSICECDAWTWWMKFLSHGMLHLQKGFSLDFNWDLDFGSFFLGLSFLFFIYLFHCFQFWKVWNTQLFVVKSASHERSAFFVCNRLHWLPKDDCCARGSVGLVSKRKKNIVNISIFLLFSFFIEVISLVTECIFWQLSETKHFVASIQTLKLAKQIYIHAMALA